MRHTSILLQFSLLLAGITVASAQTATVKRLHEFKASGLPTYLVETSPGKFLGTADVTPLIFSLDTAGNYTPIYTFPASPPTESGFFFPAVNGLTYGFASSNSTGTLEELYSIGAGAKFTAYPYPPSQGDVFVGPIQYPDGRLFATSGKLVGNTTVLMLVSLDLKGNPTTVYTFGADQGAPIYGNLVVGQDGNIYGLTLNSHGGGAGVYQITPAGAFKWMARFSAGYYAQSNQLALIQATNGNLYGTLPGGGAKHAGSIYQITPDGTYTTVYEFQHAESGLPSSLVQASDGLIYGTAQGEYTGAARGYSSIFTLDPTTGAFQTIWKFDGNNVLLGQCPCNMIQGSDGKLYGAAKGGGTVDNGTIFVLDAGLAPPPPTLQVFTPASAAPGTQVLLFGNNLLAATAVSFNGTPATTFTTTSVQAVIATVPEGATSGPVTVTTPNGTFTSTINFTVP